MSAGIDLALGDGREGFRRRSWRARWRRSSSSITAAQAASRSIRHCSKWMPKSDRIQSALAYAKSNLRCAISVEQLAEAAHLSPRQFSRAFRAETGQSPAKAVEHLRVEAARLMMEQSRHPIDVVATRNRLRRSRAHAPRLPARLWPAAAGDPARSEIGGRGLERRGCRRSRCLTLALSRSSGRPVLGS